MFVWHWEAEVSTLEIRISVNISSTDLQFIKENLKREPRAVLEISARCDNGHPLVIKTKPVLGQEIFPTLYYLVCADMVAKVGRLEAQSFIIKMQEKVDSDKKFYNLFLLAQNKYRQQRYSEVENTGRLSESQKKSLQTGIGGVKDLGNIKCLHCHLAHYLATGLNVVGGEVAKIVGFSC